MLTPLVSDVGCYIEIGGSMVWKVITGEGCSTGHLCKGGVPGVIVFVMSNTKSTGTAGI